MRTLSRLHQAAEQLLADKAGADISVTELCRAAGVHRTTFYAHFDDVADVVTAVLRRRIVELLTTGEQRQTTDIDALRDAAQRELAAMLERIADRRGGLAALGAADGLSWPIVTEALTRWVAGIHDEMQRHGAQIEADRAIGDHMVAAALTAALLRWAQATADGTEAFGGAAPVGSASVETYARQAIAALPAWWQRSPRAASTPH